MDMKVDKLIKSKIKRDYFFITGKVPMDTKYFIEEIEKGIKEKENLSFQTNLLSEMTHYHYFLKDKEFFKVMLNFLDLIVESGYPVFTYFQYSFLNLFKNYHHTY